MSSVSVRCVCHHPHHRRFRAHVTKIGRTGRRKLNVGGQIIRVDGASLLRARNMPENDVGYIQHSPTKLCPQLGSIRLGLPKKNLAPVNSLSPRRPRTRHSRPQQVLAPGIALHRSERTGAVRDRPGWSIPLTNKRQSGTARRGLSNPDQDDVDRLDVYPVLLRIEVGPNAKSGPR